MSRAIKLYWSCELWTEQFLEIQINGIKKTSKHVIYFYFTSLIDFAKPYSRYFILKSDQIKCFIAYKNSDFGHKYNPSSLKQLWCDTCPSCSDILWRQKA